jgi:hypothetical protein
VTASTVDRLRTRVRALLGVLGRDIPFELEAAPGRPLRLELRPPAAEAATWAALQNSLRTVLEAALRFDGVNQALEVRVPGGPRPSTPETDAADLAREVLRVAQGAKERGRAFAVGPLSVLERRECHRVLGELAGVFTQSEGEGIHRRLWVVPRAPKAAAADPEAADQGATDPGATDPGATEPAAGEGGAPSQPAPGAPAAG